MLKLRLRLELIFKSIFELPTKSIGKENGQDARFRRDPFGGSGTKGQGEHQSHINRTKHNSYPVASQSEWKQHWHHHHTSNHD